MDIMFKVKKPNFLIIMVDEMRFPPVYENEEIRQWREKYLKSQNLLKKFAMEFKRHYAGSTACSPSRATLFTGEYPSLHGVSQTVGMAKNSADPDVFWLDPNTVPTMGDYFERLGYRTFYKGKWHVSDSNIIIPGTNTPLDSFNPITGQPDEYYTKVYLNANRLKDYGFNGWVGPEPHGSNPNNSGSSAPSGTGGRDVVFAREVTDLIKKLEKSQDDRPWLLVASFVNPHDITLFGDNTENSPLFDFEIDPTVPFVPPPPTQNEDLSTKPSAQRSYKEVYPQALQPISNGEKYRRLYYSLEKYVDDQIHKVLKTIMNSPMYKDTIIIFTSDHGEQLGAHGLHQKWHNIYEESIHVPLIIHSPVLFSGYNSTEELTSHVDLIPTMMALANLNEETAQKKLKCDHDEVHTLVGKKICINHIDKCQINYECDKYRISEPLYFWTQDDPTQGLNQVNPFTGKPYQAVSEPNSIEAIIVYLSTKNKGIRHLYKYARYYDPNSNTTPQEYEMYNVTLDPFELRNLVNPQFSTPDIELIEAKLRAILLEQRSKKMLKPTSASQIINV
ncbi:arylsulfatase [Tupanvirus soda lake]|uniref:Arylsulfatase n=2 Tax=Tupanvirus TaxID=2094720 RepID=A0A6N1NSL3_9VIRU|nr:arylsulfatase [Tupanvirus soda lake]QKU35457.1 arylsulfatase [Tupanvirus soda lake]